MEDKKPLDKQVEQRKVVSGEVKIKKKNEMQRLADVFLAEDIADIKSYVVKEVVVPAIKKTISDTISGIFDIIRNSVDTALFGETGRRRSSSVKVPYNSIYDNRRTDRVIVQDNRPRTRLDYDSLLYPTRGDAELVLDQMEESIKDYGFVTVFDLYDFAGVDPPYISRDYGWTDIRSSAVMKVRDGYVLKLPKALPLD